MQAERRKYYRGLFLVAALYDLSIGIAFLFFYRSVFSLLGVPEAVPAYPGFVLLLGAFVFVIGVAYLLIYAGDLKRNLDLIAVGALYKLAYSAVALYALAAGDYPHIAFIVVFGAADIVFFVLMAECWLTVRSSRLSHA